MRWFRIFLCNASPAFLVPCLGLLSTCSFNWTVYVMTATLVFLLIAYFSSDLIFKLTNKFFYSWTVTSIAAICAVYQFILIPLKIITTWENVFFFFILLLCIWCIYRVKNCSLSSHTKTDGKSDDYNNDNTDMESASVSSTDECQKSLFRTYHCKICKTWIPKHHLHSVWFDCCIGLHNHQIYLLTLIAVLIWFTYASYLMLSAVCYSVLMYSSFLIPTDCSNAYYEMTSALCFVCGIYSLLISMVPVVLMAHEAWIISTGLAYRREMGILKCCSPLRCDNVSKSVSRGLYEKWLSFVNDKR